MTLPLSPLLPTTQTPVPLESAPQAARSTTGFAALLQQLGMPNTGAPMPLLTEHVATAQTSLDLAALERTLAAANPQPVTHELPVLTPQAAPESDGLDALLVALRGLSPLQLNESAAQIATMEGHEEPFTDDVEMEAESLAALAALLQPSATNTRTDDANATTQLDATLRTVSAAPAASAQATALLGDEITDTEVADTQPIRPQAGTATTHSVVSETTLLPNVGEATNAATNFELPLMEGARASQQQVANEVPTTQEPARVLYLRQPLDSAPWRAEFGQRVAQLALNQGEQRVSLQLHPAELGPLTVELRVREGQADLTFLSSHVQVRSAVQDALPQLREALSQQGIALGQADVGERAPERHAQTQQERQPATEHVAVAMSPASAQAKASTQGTRVAGPGRVNLYV